MARFLAVDAEAGLGAALAGGCPRRAGVGLLLGTLVAVPAVYPSLTGTYARMGQYHYVSRPSATRLPPHGQGSRADAAAPGHNATTPVGRNVTPPNEEVEPPGHRPGAPGAVATEAPGHAAATSAPQSGRGGTSSPPGGGTTPSPATTATSTTSATTAVPTTSTTTPAPTTTPKPKPRPPLCEAELFEDGQLRGRSWSFGPGSHDGSALTAAGVPLASTSSLRVTGPCVAVLYGTPDFSGARFAFSAGPHELAGANSEAPDNWVVALKVFPANSTQMPMPFVIHMTHWETTLSGELGARWEGNLRHFPPGTRLVYNNDAQMAASVRAVSELMSQAGVLHHAYEAFKNLRPMAFRADLWRYMMLWQHGGFTFDAEIIMVEDAVRWVDVEAPHKMWLVKDRLPGFWNAVMACTPRHPLIEQVLRYAVGQITRHAYPGNPLGITGPIALASSLRIVGLVDRGWANWDYAGFDGVEDAEKPRVVGMLASGPPGFQQVEAIHQPGRVLVREVRPAAVSPYDGLYHRRQVYCDEPGPPCKPA